MTLRIVRLSDREKEHITLKLIGRIRSDDLTTIRTEIAASGKVVAIDLEEVTLVDLEAVRFLCSCELEGIRVLNCALYIRDWITRERADFV